MRISFWLPVVLVVFALAVGCDRDEPQTEPDDLTHIPYDPASYQVKVPVGFPQLEIPADNPLTVDGVLLGRKLFFDPILSRDSTMSCASCHHPDKSFTDALGVSTGVAGLEGRRSAMSLLDVAFHYGGLFWDGRSPSLEEQALHPVEDPLELDETWDNVEARLRVHPSYPEEFRKAFGIRKSSEITRELATKAIAQFERTLVSSGNSRFDRFMRGDIFLTDSEFNGFEMFIDASADIVDAECAHCHALPLFTSTGYRNNGIEPGIGSLDDYPDAGRGEFSGIANENGFFKVPTLRNIEYTAPYMHDGRFETLEEVIDHYSDGGHQQPNKDPLIYGIHLTDSEKADLLAFLLTLSDTTFLNNPDFDSPF